MERRPGPWPLVLAGLACALIAPSGPALAQVLFDWPVRASASPEALVVGAPALLWNPAGTSAAAAERREIWVVHVDGPDASGIQGVVGAATFDLPWAGRLGIAYQHLGIPDIPRTTDSPDPEPGSLTVTEDLVVIGAGRRVAAGLGLGGSVRLIRGTVGGDQKDRVAADLGARAAFGGRWRPRAGVVLRSIGTRTDVLGGAQVAVPTPWPTRLGIDVGYGVHGTWSAFEADHRWTVRGTWDGVLVLGAGAQSNRGSPWTALGEIRLEIDRYSLAVIREGLANDFGAAHFFQATIRLN